MRVDVFLPCGHEPLRYAVDTWVQERLARVPPRGTSLVDVSGSALPGHGVLTCDGCARLRRGRTMGWAMRLATTAYRR